jgi:CDP-4-dehydro-6-deoxyglucose reductase/terephthalate 1,2-dioxygenase reductase component
MADINIGDVLHLEGPYGTMDAEHARNRPVLLIAGGTGMAPMLSLLQEILRRGLTESGITLVYGARTHTDLYCRPELEVFLATGELTLHEAIGEDTPDRVIARLEEDISKHVVYISGPPAMVNSVREILHMHRVDPANIHADSWTKEKT